MDQRYEGIIDEVVDWGAERGLTNPEAFKSQLIKLNEEVGELNAKSLRQEDLTTAIGNIQVVLILLCEQLGINYHNSLQETFDEIYNRKGETIDGVFIKQ